jgi:hypothetical protein
MGRSLHEGEGRGIPIEDGMGAGRGIFISPRRGEERGSLCPSLPYRLVRPREGCVLVWGLGAVVFVGLAYVVKPFQCRLVSVCM